MAKNRDNMLTFQVDPDVLKMVDAVRAANFKLKPILNEALRTYLSQIGFKKASK